LVHLDDVFVVDLELATAESARDLSTLDRVVSYRFWSTVVHDLLSVRHKPHSACLGVSNPLVGAVAVGVHKLLEDSGALDLEGHLVLLLVLDDDVNVFGLGSILGVCFRRSVTRIIRRSFAGTTQLLVEDIDRIFIN